MNKGGTYENAGHGDMRNPMHIIKGRIIGNSPSKLRAPYFYPDLNSIKAGKKQIGGKS